MPSRTKKIYMVIMALGAVALFVDRLILAPSVTSPRVATASAPLAAPPESVSNTNPSADNVAIPELPFPTIADKYDPTIPPTDVFATPDERKRRAFPTGATDSTAASAQASPGAGSVSAARFRSNHTLDGVMVMQRLRIAVVEGRWIRVGEEFDGCTLEEVEDQTARFSCRDGDATLTVRSQGNLPRN